MEAGGQPDPSAFQLEVARLFFALPASRGFLLAGGAALLAQHLTARPTEDLDFFTSPERGQVLTACDALETAAHQRGWTAHKLLALFDRAAARDFADVYVTGASVRQGRHARTGGSD